MKTAVFTGVLLSLAVAFQVAAGDGDAILGVWETDPNDDSGQARIEFYVEDGLYHGKIVWLEEPLYPPDEKKGTPGQPKIDLNNPNPELRDQPIMGLVLAKDFEYAGNNKWVGGTIYDPDNGKTYRCKAKLADDDTLKVRGFVGISLIGRTTQWTRVSQAD